MLAEVLGGADGPVLQRDFTVASSVSVGGADVYGAADLKVDEVSMSDKRQLFGPGVSANTKGRSSTFNADPAKSYSINVHVAAPTNGLPAGTIIACGDLKPSKASGTSKAKKPHPPQAKGPKP